MEKWCWVRRSGRAGSRAGMDASGRGGQPAMASRARAPRRPWWAARRGGSPWPGPRWRPAMRVCGGLSPGSAARHQPLQPPCPAGTQICKTRAWVPPGPRGQACGPKQRVRCPLPPSVPPGSRWDPWAACLRDAASSRVRICPQTQPLKATVFPSQALWVAGSLDQGLSGLWAGCRPGWGRRLPQAPETSRGGGAGLRRGPGTGGLLLRCSRSLSCLAPSPPGTGGHVLSEDGALPAPARPHPEDWGGWGEVGRRGLLPGYPPACPVRRSQWTFLPSPLHPPPMSSPAVPFLLWSFPRVQGWGLGWSPPLHAADRAQA